MKLNNQLAMLLIGGLSAFSISTFAASASASTKSLVCEGAQAEAMYFVHQSSAGVSLQKVTLTPTVTTETYSLSAEHEFQDVVVYQPEDSVKRQQGLIVIVQPEFKSAEILGLALGSNSTKKCR